MKPLPLFFVVFVVCFFIIIIIPQLSRVHFSRTAALPVSVTAVAPGFAVAETGLLIDEAPALHTGELMDDPSLVEFATHLINGQTDQVVGVYAPGLFALPVNQQPSGQPDYVNRENGLVTEFALPRKYGSTGLLAHNYLSGSNFFQLQPGQDVVAVYGDGQLKHYRVDDILAFRALKPNSPFSDFVDLSDPDRTLLSSADLFNRVYTTDDTLVFQTCIDNDGEPSWGRIFIVADLVEPLQLRIPVIFPWASLN